MSGPLGSQQWMYNAGAEFYDFPLEQSLRFEDGDSAYLSRTPTTAGNRKTWTWSGWVKRGNLNANTVGNIPTLFAAQDSGPGLYNFITLLNNLGSDVIYAQLCSVPANSGYVLETSQTFRDVAGWYHIVWAVDTTQATASNRAKLYVNGEQVTSFLTATYPPQNTDTDINNTVEHQIGKFPDYTRYFDGYMAEVNFIDGQQLDATSFGEFKSGIWVPKDTSGLTFGTNGFRLAFADSGAIGDDTSGNTNDWTANNLAATDVVPDSPTNNFATWSPLTASGAVFSEGNLRAGAADNRGILATFSMPTGKWYWESRKESGSTHIGIAYDYMHNSQVPISAGQASVSYYFDGRIFKDGSNLGTYTSYTNGDIIGISYDGDIREIKFYKNNTLVHTVTATSGYNYAPLLAAGSVNPIWVTNFGQDSTFAGAISAGSNTDENGYGLFQYAPPSGFLALCSANLPQGAIDTLADETPEDYFNTVLWTGDATNPRTLTGVGFEPSFSWLKSRSQAFSHRLYDQIRGGGKVLLSDTTGAESGPDNGGDITAWTADGFTTSGALNNNNLNGSGYTYVGWNWKAGGAGVSNTDGTITSTVSANQTSGFSVATYTGDGSGTSNFGHGLSAKPEMIIIKNRTGTAYDWKVFHHNLSTVGYILKLNSTAGEVNTGNTTFGGPTSSLVVVKNNGTAANATNISGVDYVAYCFHSVEGFSKVGSYTGNGSTDGSFIYTGFRPAYLLIKETSNANSWELFDTARDPDNIASQRLFPNSSQAEATTASLDMISNGFKFRVGNTGINRSGGSYIYLAIAEQPFKYANAR